MQCASALAQGWLPLLLCQSTHLHVQCNGAGTWFERRLAYTRSMAVNSMAGHIIGLGDRHLQVGGQLGWEGGGGVEVGSNGWRGEYRMHRSFPNRRQHTAPASLRVAARQTRILPLHCPPHPQNILLDTHTADAVHIDLGIAFEQVGGGPGQVRDGSGRVAGIIGRAPLGSS